MISTKTNQRILIVDDDPNLLRMMEVILERSGYHALQANSGFQALQIATEQRLDLIIIDVMMPGLDGIDCVHQLRAKPATRNIPIIVLSAMGEMKDKVRGFEAGVDDYVTKPVNPRELMLRVKALLSRANLTVTRIITIIGAKGGVGTTTVAANTAIALTQQGKSTTLTDMRAHGGTLQDHFKLSSDDTMQRLLEVNPTAIKRQEIEHCTTTHKSGLKLLISPTTYHESVLTATHVELFLEGLSTNSDYIILDLPARPDPAIRRALELSDHVLLVTEPETLSINCARRQLELFKEWNVYSRTNVIVVNRVRTNISTFSQIEIEIRLGMRSEKERDYHWDPQTAVNNQTTRQGVIATIPSSPEMLHEALKGQMPYLLVEPGSHAAHSIMDIGDWIIEKHK